MSVYYLIFSVILYSCFYVFPRIVTEKQDAHFNCTLHQAILGYILHSHLVGPVPFVMVTHC